MFRTGPTIHSLRVTNISLRVTPEGHELTLVWHGLDADGNVVVPTQGRQLVESDGAALDNVLASLVKPPAAVIAYAESVLGELLAK